MLRHDGDGSIHFCLFNGPIASAAVATNTDMRKKKEVLLEGYRPRNAFMFLGKDSFTA